MRVPTRRGDYRRPKPDPFLTEDKVNELKAKLERLKKVTRLKLMKEVATEAENGDFSENAAYQIAKGKLRGINQAIIDIEEHLKKAVVIEQTISGCVNLGSTVTVEVNGQEKKYLILGSSEADPTKNIISHHSPIGAALMGKRVGDSVEVLINNKKLRYTILAIK